MLPDVSRSVELSTDGTAYLVRFSSRNTDAFRATLEAVKAIDGRQFVPRQKHWEVPVAGRQELLAAGFPVPEPVAPDTGPPAWTVVRIPEDRVPELRPYQLDGLRFFTWRGGRGLLADDMGLGKTPQALCYLRINPARRPVLILVPATIKIQWERAWRRWVGNGKTLVCYGRQPKRIPDYYEAVIINWDLIFDWLPSLIERKFEAIIADECQAVGSEGWTQRKAKGSKRTAAFQSLVKANREAAVLALSGTPLRSRPAQLFTILNVLDADKFPKRYAFQWRYCDPKPNGFGWEFKGASHIDELHQKVKTLMLRREKEDVLTELPAKQRTVVPLEIDDMSAYAAKWEEIADTLETANGKQAREQIDALKFSAFSVKKDMAIRWIKDWLDDSGKKIIVFAYHRSVVEYLREEFPRSAVVYGGLTGQARDRELTKFTGDANCNVLIANILAGGVGIDGLQNVCSNAAFVEFGWSSTDHDQAEDRLHRFGQQDPVNVYYLIAPETIDEELMEIVDRKAGMIKQILDGRVAGDQDLLGELLGAVREKKERKSS